MNLISLEWILIVFVISSCEPTTHWTIWRSKSACNTDCSYRWSNQTKINRSQAADECAKQGWQLAKILDEKEDNFIRDHLRAIKAPSTWIGLKLKLNWTIAEQEGEWSDGSLFKWSNASNATRLRDYADWADDEPKSMKKPGPCVYMYKKEDYKWDDNRCRIKRSFICQVVEGKLAAQLQEMSTQQDIRKVDVDLAIAIADELLWSSNITDPKNTLDALDGIVEGYQGKDDYHGTKPLLDITINSTTRADNLTFGSQSNLNLVLHNSLINEAFSRNERNLSILRIASILCKSLTFFPANAAVSVSRASVDNKIFETQPILPYPFMNFGEDAIFRLPRKNAVGSSISASVSNVTMANLTNRVEVTSQNVCQIQILEFEDYKGTHQIRCVYWNSTHSDWLEDGCATEKSPDPLRSNCYNVTCRCNHMTHFTVVFDSSYIYAPKYLNIMTITGGAICGTFLLITCTTILFLRHMRHDIHKCIIFNISLNLFLFQLMFFVGIDQGSTPTRWCHATSYLLHLFTLTSWFWMLVESVYLLLSLCLRDNSSPKVRKIILVCGFFAYGVPALTASLTIRHQKPYLSPKYCWLASTAVFRTVVIPVISIWTINILVGGFAIYHITCAPRVAKMLHNMAKIRQAIRRIVFLSLLLGFPWISGLAMLFAQDSKTKTIVSIIFTVFLTMQGIAIFTAFCASDDIFRKRVKSAFAGLKCVSTAKSREVTEYLNIGSFESHQAYRITTVSRPGDTPAGLRAH